MSKLKITIEQDERMWTQEINSCCPPHMLMVAALVLRHALPPEETHELAKLEARLSSDEKDVILKDGVAAAMGRAHARLGRVDQAAFSVGSRDLSHRVTRVALEILADVLHRDLIELTNVDPVAFRAALDKLLTESRTLSTQGFEMMDILFDFGTDVH
jgi:hypothetical protein